MASKTSEYYSDNPKAKAKKDAYNKAYGATEKEKKRRAARNAARAKLKKEGKVSKGQDVHHKDGNPRNNSSSNLKAESKSKNRGRK